MYCYILEIFVKTINGRYHKDYQLVFQNLYQNRK